MDPEETLRAWENHLNHQRVSEAVAHMGYYYHWRVKGGFQPANGDARAELLAARTADAVEELQMTE